jgi:hypothetical protein
MKQNNKFTFVALALVMMTSVSGVEKKDEGKDLPRKNMNANSVEAADEKWHNALKKWDDWTKKEREQALTERFLSIGVGNVSRTDFPKCDTRRLVNNICNSKCNNVLGHKIKSSNKKNKIKNKREHAKFMRKYRFDIAETMVSRAIRDITHEESHIPWLKYMMNQAETAPETLAFDKEQKDKYLECYKSIVDYRIKAIKGDLRHQEKIINLYIEFFNHNDPNPLALLPPFYEDDPESKEISFYDKLLNEELNEDVPFGYTRDMPLAPDLDLAILDPTKIENFDKYVTMYHECEKLYEKIYERMNSAAKILAKEMGVPEFFDQDERFVKFMQTLEQLGMVSRPDI